MKTLDEVIRDMEDSTEHLSAVLVSKKTWGEALHYLKAYQGYLIGKEISDALDEAFTEIYNPPLTWDELKQMKGKPVWVKLFGSGFGEWDLCHTQLDDRIWFTDISGLIFDLSEETLGKTWQAYRKEKDEES